ncbi:histidine kinase [Cavenderia fasciculata]|uniref:Histidine kinase n=1 Tax=Cavenderia fasciculata TaxID=261658 RepID=F4Q1A6_CACFS|nr:histidine kinase [Cavenderia fasciculata]EGG18607.1 histidine kinase [Cavenderia fasciculata]|eukprot:XP_004366511.1 histidine kinase [Cavenderia fasciculata]
MSFKLTWGPFDEEFYNNIKTGLTKTLNAGPPIPNIVDQLAVHDFHLGDKPPQLELKQVADASKEKFKFIFHVNYRGNGLLELRTKVQANPVYLGTSIALTRHEKQLLQQLNIGSASNPHIMPLSIIITDIVFDGELTVALVNNKSIEASFTTDPLKQVNIKTSFDEFPAVANFIKSLVDTQLRNFIMKDFPTIVSSITVPSPSSPNLTSAQSMNSISINQNNQNNQNQNNNLNNSSNNINSNNNNSNNSSSSNNNSSGATNNNNNNVNNVNNQQFFNQTGLSFNFNNGNAPDENQHQQQQQQQLQYQQTAKLRQQQKKKNIEQAALFIN